MKLSLPTAFLFLLITSYAQVEKTYSYLIIRLESDFDNNNKRQLWAILPDLSNPHAKEIYSLITYNAEKRAINKTANFYPEVKDTAQPFYNYFTDQSQALQFIGSKGWELHTVRTKIHSDWKSPTLRDGIYTVVTSKPVYYLRKTILLPDTVKP